MTDDVMNLRAILEKTLTRICCATLAVFGMVKSASQTALVGRMAVGAAFYLASPFS
jgi:hypothetical protein